MCVRGLTEKHSTTPDLNSLRIRTAPIHNYLLSMSTTILIAPDSNVDTVRRSTVTDSILFKYNVGGCVLHSVQGTLMLIASQSVESIKNFKKEIVSESIKIMFGTENYPFHDIYLVYDL